VVAQCSFCGTPHDRYETCASPHCRLLVLSCPACRALGRVHCCPGCPDNAASGTERCACVAQRPRIPIEPLPAGLGDMGFLEDLL
jgi:hypothetical protein